MWLTVEKYRLPVINGGKMSDTERGSWLVYHWSEGAYLCGFSPLDLFEEDMEALVAQFGPPCRVVRSSQLVDRPECELV